jgi:hypothetical protein
MSYCHALTFIYSTNRLRKATKCSAFRIFPGTASDTISSDKTACERGILSLRVYRKQLEHRHTWIGQNIVLLSTFVRIVQPCHQLRILVLQFRGIRPLDSAEFGKSAYILTGNLAIELTLQSCFPT